MKSKKRVLSFFSVCVLALIAANLAHPVTPTLFKGLGFGDYMFGYALAIMLVVNFMFSPFWGKMNSYLSSRKSMLICYLGYGAGQLFFAMAQTETQFLLARMLAGVFTSGTLLSMMNYIINTTPDERQRGTYLTVYATITSVAAAFGYFIGGMLGEIHVRFSLYVQAALLCLCGVLFMLVCEDDHKLDIKSLSRSEFVRDANPFAAFIQSRKFMTAAMVVLLVACMLQNLCQTAFDQSFNYYVNDQFQLTTAYNGVFKAVMGIATFVLNSTLCIYLVRRTNYKKSVIGVLAACSLVGVAVLLLQSRMLPFIVANITFYTLSALSIPLLQQMTADSAMGNDSNLVMGMYNAVRSLGGIAGAGLSGALYAIRPIFPFGLSTIAFALAAVCAAVYYKMTRRAQKTQR